MLDHVGEDLAPPQRQRGVDRGGRPGDIALHVRASRASQCDLEAVRVELAGIDAQRVAPTGADEPVGADDLAQLRDVALERRPDGGVGPPRPQVLHQLVRGDLIATPEQEPGHDRYPPGAADPEPPAVITDLDRTQDAELHARPPSQRIERSAARRARPPKACTVRAAFVQRSGGRLRGRRPERQGVVLPRAPRNLLEARRRRRSGDMRAMRIRVAARRTASVLTAGVMLASTAAAFGVLVISPAAPASADSVGGSVPGTHVQGPGTCLKIVPPGAEFFSIWTSFVAYNVKDITIGRDGQGPLGDVLSTSNPSVAPLALDMTVPAPGPLAKDTVDRQVVTAHDYPLESWAPDSKMIVTSVPAHAHDFSWNTDGSFYWNPVPGYEGGDSFTYTVEDTQGYCYGNAIVTIPPPRADHLADDSYTAYNDRTTTSGGGGLEVCGTNISPIDAAPYPACGVLKNDDASFVGGLAMPGDGHFPIGLDQPTRLAHGSVDVRRDGSWSYTPDAGYVGDDTFYYMGFYDSRFHSIALHDGSTIAEFTASFPYAGVAQVTFHVENPPAPSYVQNSPVSLSVDENTTRPSTFTPLTFDPRAVLTAAQPDASPVIGVNGVLGDVQGLGTNPPTSVRTEHGTLGLTWGLGFVDASGSLVPCSVPTCAFQKIYISNITYTPDPEYFGADEFDYSTLGMYFPKGVPSTQWPNLNTFTPVRVPVHITVNEVRTMPGLISTTLTVPNHHGVTFHLADTMDDPDGVARIDGATYQEFDLTPTGELGGSSGTLVSNGGGSYTFTATSVGAPSDVVVFLFSIPTTLGPEIAQPEVTFTVTPDGAVDDSYSTDENQMLTVSAAAGVLANDAPPGVASLQTQAQDGTVSLAADGSFTYVPNQNFSGTDTFAYLDDGAPGIVTVAVNHVLQPPVVMLNSPGCNPLLICPHSDPDNRLDLAAGANGRLRGFVTDPEFSHGTMTIDWGDGTTTNAAYPPSSLSCLPGSDCPFSSRATYGFPCGVSPCPGTPLYFEFDHQYASVPGGPPTTFTISRDCERGRRSVRPLDEHRDRVSTVCTGDRLHAAGERCRRSRPRAVGDGRTLRQPCDLQCGPVDCVRNLLGCRSPADADRSGFVRRRRRPGGRRDLRRRATGIENDHGARSERDYRLLVARIRPRRGSTDPALGDRWRLLEPCGVLGRPGHDYRGVFAVGDCTVVERCRIVHRRRESGRRRHARRCRTGVRDDRRVAPSRDHCALHVAPERSRR